MLRSKAYADLKWFYILWTNRWSCGCHLFWSRCDIEARESCDEIPWGSFRKISLGIQAMNLFCLFFLPFIYPCIHAGTKCCTSFLCDLLPFFLFFIFYCGIKRTSFTELTDTPIQALSQCPPLSLYQLSLSVSVRLSWRKLKGAVKD